MRHRALVTAIVLAATAMSFLRVPAVRGDPTLVDNGDGTSDAVWDFTTPADYALTETEILAGSAALARQPVFWWNETSAADFAGPDSETNIDRARWPGEVALATTSGPMTLLTVQPGATGEDSWLDRNNRGMNYGTSTTMTLDGRNPESRPILRFDFSAIPAGAVIDDGVFSLYQSAGFGNPVTTNVQAATAAWNELQVTWDNRLTGTPWTTFGGDYSPHVVDVKVLDNTVGWRSWNVTALVDLWYRGRMPNYGLLLVAPNPGVDSDKTLYSSDYNVDPTRRPKLDVRYRVLGSAGTYVSKVGGPGTMARWLTISWNATEHSLATDEFSGPGLDPRWTWTNPPASYDVDATTPGSLHVVSSTGVDFSGGTLTGNVLANDLVGDFTATMKFSTNEPVSGQKAGLMVLVGPRDWYAVWKMNAAGIRNWRVAATADAVTTARVNVNSGNPIPAWVRIQRVGTTFTASTSTDGVVWTTRDAYTPVFEYPLSVRLALTFADGGSGTALTTDVDYVRITFGNDATVAVSTRTGDVTPVDGTWTGFTAPYPTPASSAMAGTGRYIEYRLSLSVTYPDHVPVVGDANLSWFRYAPTGTVETNDLVPADLAAWGTLTTVHALNNETITYAYSLDSGGGWTPVVPPADFTAVSTATGRIRFRASLSTANTLVTPTVSEIRLTYTHVLDHFEVTALPTAAAGAPFSVTVTAKDAGNSTIVAWTGTVTLAAFLADGVTPGGGVLGTTTLAISSGGTATLGTETYTKAETIRVGASFGGASGLSGLIVISPGPVTRVVISPTNVTLLPFDTQVFVGQAFDLYDNPVPGASFNWTVGGGVGTLNVSSGTSVLFTASPPPANGTLQMAFGASTDVAQVQVVSGTPPWVAIASPAAGAHVTGVVPIAYTNSSDAVTVRFDYDGGSGWTLIGIAGVLNGTYLWDTSSLDFVGGALRAIVTNNRSISNTTIVSPIEVDNTPPAIAILSVTDNQATNGTLAVAYATDADVVRVDFSYFNGSWSGAGSDVTIDGFYVWTPGVPINGVTLRAVAVDEVNLNGSDERTGVGSYNPGANPPAIAPIPDLYVRVGAPYVLNLTFYLSDPDTPLAALVIWDSDPANVTANAGAFPSLNVTYGAAGTYLVTLWVSDGTSTAWTIVRIVATANAPPTLVSPIPAVAFDEDTVAADALGAPATAFFLDPDGDPLAFAILDGNRVSARVNANATVDLWAAANWSGSETLRIRATDPTGAFAESAFAVLVRPINDAPVLLIAFPPVTFDEDATATNAFGGNATGRFLDVDGDLLTVSVLGGGNVSARVNPDGTIDLWAAVNWSGSESLRVRVTDPSGAFAEGPFLVVVRPVNDAPTVVLALPAVAFDEDTVASNAFAGPVNVHFADVDGDSLTFTVTGTVQITARVNADRTVDLWAAANWSGSESLGIRATDPSGAWAEAPFVVLVRPVNDAPVLLPIATFTMNEGETRTLDLSPYVSDIDTNRSLLVVTTGSSVVAVNGFVLTLAFPSNWTDARFTVTVFDGALAASQTVVVTIVPPWWKSVYFLPVPPVFLAVVIGVFVQRSRWRPTKAFLVDERNAMIREFTLDRACDVTFDQVREAGALDAVDKSVKVSKYHAQTVRGDALGLVLLAYGPVTADQIEFAREMLVNIQGKFEDRVQARLGEARAAEASLAPLREALEAERAALVARTDAVVGMYDAVNAGSARIAEDVRVVEAHAADLAEREAAVRETARSTEERARELAALEGPLESRAAEVQSQEARMAELAASLDARQAEIERLRENLPAREKAALEQEARNKTVEADLHNREREVAEARKATEEARESVARDREALAAERAALDAAKQEFGSHKGRFTDDIRNRSQELDAQSRSLQEMQATLTQARDGFEAMRQEKTAWIASKDIELEAREHTLNEKEAGVRAQAESNAKQLADLAAREETSEIDGDRLEKERAALAAWKGELTETVGALDGKATALRDLEATKAEEYRAWEASLASQQALLKEQKETFERETAEQRAAMTAKRGEIDAQAAEFAAREAKVRTSVEWVMRMEDAVKVRETQAADVLDAGTVARAEVEAAREQLAARAMELEAREAAVQEESRRQAEELSRRGEALKAGEAALADRRAAIETEFAESDRKAREAEAELAKQEQSFAEKTVVLFSRESKLDSLKESLDRERADLDGLAQQLEAKQVELSQLIQRNEEEGARLRAEVDAARHSVAADEARLRAEQERLARESNTLQETLGAKAKELTAKEAAFGERERVLVPKEQEAEARLRDVEFRERQAAESDRDLGARAGMFEKQQRDVEARSVQLDEATRKFAKEQELKRSEWETRHSEQERLARESSALQETLGAKAEEIAAKEAGMAERERVLVPREQEAAVRLRDVESRERQAPERDRELGVREGLIGKQQRDVEARANQLDEATRKFAKEQELKRSEWEGRYADLQAQGSRSKSQAEAQLTQLNARSADLDRREQEVAESAVRVEREHARLVDNRKDAEAKQTEASAAWTRTEVRSAEVKAIEEKVQRSRQAFEAERAAWIPRRDEEMRQLEARRDAASEESQRAEKLLEEAEQRITIAAEAEKSANWKVGEAESRQAELAARQAELEKAERATGAQSSEIQEALRKLGAREIDLAATAKDLEARTAKLDARTKEAATTSEDLKARKAGLDKEADRLAKLSKEVESARKKSEAESVEAEARLVDVVQREKDAKAKEADIRTREAATQKVETALAKREAGVAEREAAANADRQRLDQLGLEVEGATAKADEDRKVAGATRADADALGEKAQKMLAQAESQQAEVANSMKFLQKKAVDVLDREEKTRKHEAAIDEREKLVESQFEVVEGKSRSLEIDRHEAEQKVARLEAEIGKLRARLAEAEKGGRPAADLADRDKDLENRLKIIQRKAMELLDREEKVRLQEEELRERAAKLGVEH